MKLRLLIAVVAGICMLAKGADETPPTIVQVQPAAGTVTSLTNITVTFSEQIEGISIFDFLVNGQMADAITGAEETWTFSFPQPTHGTVLINWDINHTIADLAGNRFNENGPGATWQYNFVDTSPPVITLLTPAAGLTVRQLTQIEVQFNEAVSGIDAADLVINSTPAASMTVLGQGRYRFGFLQPAAGTVQVAWAANHQIRDFASPANAFAGGNWSYTLDPTAGFPDVRINEFLSANATGLRDENAEYQDWIEIHNRGSTMVNLAGWSLTDDPNDPGKWVFPSTNVAAGQFLVVFASAKDRRAPTGTNRFHTNFQLNSGGGYLGLFNGESPRVAVTEFADFPVQRNDHSYGYDSNQVLKYFSVPTPGAPNAGSQISGIVPQPHFNVDRGWFDTPFTLYLSCPESGATIRYTIDGSEPTLANGINYTGPLQITNTTVLRAIATKANMLPSLSLTHTYLFLAQVLNQPMNPSGYPTGATYWQGYPSDYEMDSEIVTNSTYGPQVINALKALPSVSIGISVDHMFGPTNGIYTHTAEGGGAFQGVAWERPCSMEFIPTNNDSGFQANCGIRIQGNASRNPQKTPKHPFRLLFKGDYGPNRLDEKVYPDSPVQSYNTLVMRADFNNSWLHWDPNQRARGTRIRDAWTKDTWREMGQPGSHSRYFHLFINGLYWGIYDFGERVDATFAANYLGGEPQEYDAIASKPVEATDGDLVAYNTMRSRALLDQRFLSNYVSVLDMLDAGNFADYMLLNFFGANQDWGNDSNWNAVRRRTPDGKFKYISWDGEQLLVGTNDNRVSNTDVPGGVHTSLINSPEYRLTFADRAHKHLFNGGALTPAATAQRWAKRVAELDLAVIAESTRWGDYRRDMHQYQNPPYVLFTKNDYWLPEVNRLLTNYFPIRTAIVLNQLKAAGLYPNHAAPAFSQYGGRVARNYALTITATNDIYYTLDNTDPRQFGAGAVALGATLYTGGSIVLSNSVIVKARALFGTNWSALAEATFQVAELGPTIRITEIMYNPTGGDAYEYLVLKNVGTAPLNLGGYSFDGINYIFAPAAVIAAGASIVLASDNNPAAWAGRYPALTAFGFFGGSLSNGGEKLALKDPDGNIVYSLDYDDENGWDTAADGRGPSLKVADPLADPDDPANWSSAPPVAASVVLNEVMADNVSAVVNGGTYPDWVELRNTGGQSVNLGGWSISDDSNARKYVFPGSTSIPGGGYLVVWCDSPTNAAPGLHTGFALGRKGETVSLFNASTTRADAITFGLQLADYSVGRMPEGWKLNAPTPGAANIAAATASTGNLSINEWLANAPPGGSDWIELFNRSSSSPVALRGIFIGNGNTVHQLNSLSFIAPSGFVQLFAAELAGPDQLDFKLPAAGGAIVLYDESAIELERVNYGPQTESVTQGRLPDGTATIATFNGSASPGANNYVINYSGPILNEIAAGLGWVELRNPNGASADISGMRLTTDLAEPGQYIFPPSTSVPGNGYLVVTLGDLLDDESGAVYLLNTNAQVVDSVVYGFQVPDLSIGRSGAQWVLLASVTPGAANAPAAPLGSPTLLRINEWLANPAEDNDWFELYNSDSSPVALAGLYVTDNPSIGGLRQFQFYPLSFIGAKGFVRVVADADPSDGRNHVNFNLSAEGESLRLVGDSVIDSIYFGAQEINVSQGRVPDGGPDIVTFPQTPTPRASNYLPLPNARINEVLPNPQAPAQEAIEIYNPSSLGIDLGGWYLSNHPRNHKMYRIPEGTFLPAGGYLVFQATQFGFALGGYVSLSEADSAGNLSGRRSVATSSQAPAGKSFGTVQTCTGSDFVELLSPTLGGYNMRPRVGAVVINEIMYHPPTLNSNENNIDEYIELHNQTGGAVALDGWQLRNAVSFTFPSNTSIPAEGFLVAVSFDPEVDVGQLVLFRSKFNVPEEAPVVGPWRGNLGNAGETIELYRPSEILVERVAYDDLAPWPTSGDGDGNSLQRNPPQPFTNTHDFGNDAANWHADVPSAGASNSVGAVQAPVFVTQPVSRAVPAGTRVEFNVDVCGTMPIGYQWQRETSDIPGGWSPSFVIPSATAADAGNYRVIVSNFVDRAVSLPATLIIQSPPAITQQPQPIVTPSGTNVSFTVAASGAGPFTYQWRKNGIALSGKTNTTLDLFDVQVSDSGDYSALVANAAGAVPSATANLEVFQRVRILVHPQSLTVNTNTSVRFSVNAGTGALRYQWRYFGQDMQGQTNQTLDIASAQLEDSGDYTALVYDNRSSAESLPATLTLLVRPSVVRPPGGLTVAVGSNVTISAGVYGSWPITNRWRRGTVNVLTNSLPAKQTNATLLLANIQTNQAGGYQLGVLNQSGSSPLSSAGFVTVVIPPTNLTVQAGTDATLTVQAFGLTRILYQWKSGANDIAGATNTTLVLTNVQTSQSGVYSVVVSAITNAVIAPATFSANLTVEAGPPVLSEPRSLPAGEFQFLLTGGSNITYALQFSRDLTNWTTFTNVPYTTGPVTVTDPAAVSDSRRFYRALKP